MKMDEEPSCNLLWSLLPRHRIWDIVSSCVTVSPNKFELRCKYETSLRLGASANSDILLGK